MSTYNLLRGNFNKLQIRNITTTNAVALRSTSALNVSDQPTHTGQQWDDKDYRLVRFTNNAKHVNPNWAIKLIDEIPPKECKERVVWCDGGGGPTGHPKVFINLDKPGNHACGYCGLRFFKGDHNH